MADDKTPAVGKRLHKATYAKDKLKGGYLVRVEGLHSNMFAGRDVPVVRKDDSETVETLDSLIWTGKDNESGKPVTLYSFVAKPKDDIEVAF